jgi:hypothetical protein
LAAPDTTPPSVPTNLTATTVSSSQINLAWTASADAVGVTGYQIERCQNTGCTTGFTLVTTVTGTPPAITYNNISLASGTTNGYRLRAQDAAGNLSGYSSPMAYAATTTPPDTTPPVITNITAGNITSTGSTVTWTTNEPADSQVEYGLTTAYGNSVPVPADPTLVTSHSVALSGLTASTLYHYRVKSRDAAGNLATSGDATLTTLALPDTTPPAISAVAAGSISNSVATISWTTNEASDSQVEYGTTTSYGSSSPLNTTLVTGHSVALSGLTASTLYHYRVKSRDAAGNLAVSGDATLTTAATGQTPVLLSQGLPVTSYKASSSYSTATPEKAFDGSTTTIWNSGGFAPRWIYVDLGSMRSITEVRVLAGTGSPAGTTNYAIDVSSDTTGSPTTWTTTATGSNASATAYTITGVSAGARYVRIYVTGHTGNSWIALYEVQVFGN